MELLSTPLRSCVCCGSKNLTECLDLGMQPPPNAIHDGPNYLKHPLPVPPPLTHELILNVCQDCWHAQLRDVVDSGLLFNSYPYRTGVSETLKKHYYHFALDTCMGIRFAGPKRILDIGCNDGTLLGYFKEFGWHTVGVDPCPVVDSYDNSVNYIDHYIKGFWTHKLVEYESLEHKFPLITGTNVFAHVPDPAAFLMACRLALTEDGTIILEFPYQLKIIQDCQFDTIYFEHISYFSVNSLLELLNDTGLCISDIFYNKIHGGSLRVSLKKCEFGSESKYHTDKIVSFYIKEEAAGLFLLDTYRKFSEKIYNVKSMLTLLIDDMRDTSHAIVGFGASGKGSVLLNYCEIDLDFIIDQTPCKVGKFSPGRNIPIVSLDSQIVRDVKPMCFLILVWNCLNECLLKISNARRNLSIHDKYIVYVPSVQFHPLNSHISKECGT